MLFNKLWWKAALVRAVRTVAQTIVGAVAVGAAFQDVDWLRVISVSAVAGLLSIFTSLAGLPEVELAEQDAKKGPLGSAAPTVAIADRRCDDADGAPKEGKIVFLNTVDDPKPEQGDGDAE